VKVLITGANGLLGANVAREFLAAGAEVGLFVRPSADLRGIAGLENNILEGNLLSFEEIAEAVRSCDAVIHTASTTSQRPKDFDFYESINVGGTRSVVQALLRYPEKRLIHVSTANVFGPGSKQKPGNELSPFALHRLESGYIKSKRLAQEYVLEAVRKHGLDAVVVNPTFMIGPYDSKPSSGEIILYGWRTGIQWYPPGGKNFVHVNDVAKGIVEALAKGKTGECYLLAGENLTYKDFFSMVNEVAQRQPLSLAIPRPFLNLAGSAGDLWNSMSKNKVSVNTINMKLLSLDNYYTGEKAWAAFSLKVTPIRKAIGEAVTWFVANGYIK
jgi:dihydroflavonol-4-reductase